MAQSCALPTVSEPSDGRVTGLAMESDVDQSPTRHPKVLRPNSYHPSANVRSLSVFQHIPSKTSRPQIEPSPPSQPAVATTSSARPCPWAATRSSTSSLLGHVPAFHSPALRAAIDQPLVPPCSVYFGGWADRSTAEIIQLARVLYMSVSAIWGVLFLTNSLQVWHCLVLLSMHAWRAHLSPRRQLMLHDLAGREPPPRPFDSTRQAETRLLAGPALGSVVLLVRWPPRGIFANLLMYLPMTIWLAERRSPATSARPGPAPASARSVMHPARGHPAAHLNQHGLLGGLSSFLIGSGIQPQMPESPSTSASTRQASATACCWRPTRQAPSGCGPQHPLAEAVGAGRHDQHGDLGGCMLAFAISCVRGRAGSARRRRRSNLTSQSTAQTLRFSFWRRLTSGTHRRRLHHGQQRTARGSGRHGPSAASSASTGRLA